MSLLTTLKTSNLGDGEISKARPEILLAGDPTFTTWNQVDSKGGTVATGVWQATPGEQWPQRLAELATATAAAGKGTIIVVPDQRDLDRLVEACEPLLGDRCVSLTAGLGPSARYRRWLAVSRGTASVVV